MKPLTKEEQEIKAAILKSLEPTWELVWLDVLDRYYAREAQKIKEEDNARTRRPDKA